MARITLTDRFIKSAKAIPAAGRLDHHDSVVPGLALRVTAKGHKSFVLIARYPTKPKHPTRRVLGEYGELTLEQARERAREWLALLHRGIDPKVELARQIAEARRQQATTFRAVADEFLTRHADNLAKAADARRSIGEFTKRFGDLPIRDVQPEDVAAVVRAIVDRDAKYQAFNALGFVRRMFTWALGTSEFGLDASPVDRLRPRDLIGQKEVRQRILTDAELRRVWEAAGGMGYPYGPLFRLLILTGQRVREIGDLRWREISLDAALVTIGADRMKGDRAHDVPLAPLALAMARSLPRFVAGDAVFSTTSGARPVNGYSRAKENLDKLAGVTDWVLHDLRRTMRTHLSALPIQDVVREATIAHAKGGLHRVYDQHAYLDEKRQALTLWEARLCGVLGFSAAYGPVPRLVDQERSEPVQQ